MYTVIGNANCRLQFILTSPMSRVSTCEAYDLKLEVFPTDYWSMLYDVDIEASACVLSSRYSMLCYAMTILN